MATPLAEATAAPFTIKIGAEDRTIRPFALLDYGYWERWARAAHLKASDEAADGLKPESRRQMLREAHESAAKIWFGSPRALGYLLSIEGKIECIALALSEIPGKPLKGADVWKLFCNANGQADFGEINRVWCDVLEVSGFYRRQEGHDPNPQMAASSIFDLLS